MLISKLSQAQFSGHSLSIHPSIFMPFENLNRKSQRLATIALLAFACLFSPVVHGFDVTQFQAEYNSRVQPFLKNNCYHCHNDRVAKAGFRVDNLSTNFLDGRMADHWKEAMDMMNLGEMPPEDEIQPEIENLAVVVDWINTGLRQAELQAKNAGGAIPVRRMNREEYANTVRDLFSLDEEVLAPIMEKLPADGSAEGFDRLGVALFFDKIQMDRTIDVATAVAEKAVVDMAKEANTEAPDPSTLKFVAAEEMDPPNEKVTARFSGHTVDNQIPAGPPSYVIRENGVELVSAPSSSHSGREWAKLQNVRVQDTITEDGYYTIRIRAEDAGGERPEPHQFRIEYGAAHYAFEQIIELDPAGVTELTVFLRAGPPDVRKSMRFSWNQQPDVIVTEPKYASAARDMFEAIKAVGKAKKTKKSASEIAAAEREMEAKKDVLRQWTGPATIWNPEIDLAKVPRLLFKGFEIEGPVREEWPPKFHQRFFFAGDERQDAEYAREMIERFLPFAYRRPVSAKEVNAVTEVAVNALEEGLGFYPAMRRALVRVLISPKFLFLAEPSGHTEDRRRLNDFELATRLSYFLWSSMPDEPLFSLAAAGQLSQPEVLDAQILRMLNDPKAKAFVRNFAGQWLDVRNFGSIEPAEEYKDYDEALEEAGQREPYQFFAEILSRNLPITNFIDSDFVMVNERLAQHYGIKGVQGPEFRKVAIGPDVPRGGIFGMAGLMTHLSDGTRTLPIRRATWVKTKLFDDPPGNPPPNAGEIQPNTAGENLTVRERLEKHRNEPTCASCHATLDPYGLALENYDVIGAWRERANGENFRGNNRPHLDVAGTLPNGASYQNLDEFKAALLQPEMREKFARAFSKQLLTYALGRPVGYTDHATLDKLVADLEANNFAIHPLITSIVMSELFLTK